MGRASVFEALDKIRSGLPVLLGSGRAGAEQGASALGRRCTGLLQKPFGLRQRSERVAEISGAQRSG